MAFSYRYRIGSFNRIDPGSKAGKLVFGVFLAVGLVFLLIAGGFALHQSAKAKEYLPTEAVIIDLDRKGTPTVEYKIEGITITKKLNTSSALYSIGDTIPIAYDAGTPTRIIQLGIMAWLFPAIFGSIGLAFALIGGVSLIRILRREKRGKEDLSPPWES